MSTLQLIWLNLKYRKLPRLKSLKPPADTQSQLKGGSHIYLTSSGNTNIIFISKTKHTRIPQDKDHSCPTLSLLGWWCVHLEPLQTKPLLVSGGRYSLYARTCGGCTKDHTSDQRSPNYEQEKRYKTRTRLTSEAAQQIRWHHQNQGQELWVDIFRHGVTKTAATHRYLWYRSTTNET